MTLRQEADDAGVVEQAAEVADDDHEVEHIAAVGLFDEFELAAGGCEAASNSPQLDR
jgi:hypothetical protein